MVFNFGNFGPALREQFWQLERVVQYHRQTRRGVPEKQPDRN